MQILYAEKACFPKHVSRRTDFIKDSSISLRNPSRPSRKKDVRRIDGQKKKQTRDTASIYLQGDAFALHLATGAADVPSDAIAMMYVSKTSIINDN